MANKRYWGRFFIGGEWGLWHLITTRGRLPKDKAEALKIFRTNVINVSLKNTKITDREPKRFAGKYGLNGKREPLSLKR